jgi:hypothetical protein
MDSNSKTHDDQKKDVTVDRSWTLYVDEVTARRIRLALSGNAVEWAVRRLDASLDEAELAPPPGAKAIINVARGPVGSATVQGVTAAARVTVKVGTTALKVGSIHVT